MEELEIKDQEIKDQEIKEINKYKMRIIFK
jgi:hypothetical protein